ncbi:MAG: hypothetical protein WDW38_004750 [Sanguina aurantia]
MRRLSAQDSGTDVAASELSFSALQSGTDKRNEDEEPLTLEGEELVQRLQVIGRIGGGSTARVYRALFDGAPAALKVLHPSKAQKERSIQEFLREAHIMHKCRHRSIVRVLALCHVPPRFPGLPTKRYTWGILLELMETGRPGLDNRRRSKPTTSGTPATSGPPRTHLQPLPAAHLLRTTSSSSSSRALGAPVCDDATVYTDAEALSWVTDTARALAHLHSQRPAIVHRDVKTENILLTKAAPLQPRLPRGVARGAAVTLASVFKPAVLEHGGGGGLRGAG